MKCANCGKIVKLHEFKLIKFGKQIFIVCDLCKEECQKFKQRNS